MKYQDYQLMSKEMENNGVPRLRFPEFVNCCKWEETTLGNVGQFIGGGTPDTTNPQYWDGNVQWFTPSEIKQRYLSKSVRTITEIGLQYSSAKLLPVGTLLITTRATIGDIGIATIECTTNQGFQSLCVSNEEVNVFWYYWINYNKYELIRRASGSTFPEIGKTEIVKIKALRPHRLEQQKIADCLSSLDDLITAETERLELLKAHKKGLMQNLFPQEGETVPRLRFPEFKDAKNWERRTIGEIAKVTTGNKDTQNKINNGLYPFFVRSQTIERINSFSFEGEAILTSGDGVGVGKNFHYINGKFDYHQRVYCIYAFNNSVFGKFVFSFFSEHFYDRVMKMSAKNSVDSVRMAMITDMPILIPDITEQQKIASLLTSVEEQINTQTEKIENLKLHKKGLMQQLFPSTNDLPS